MTLYDATDGQCKGRPLEGVSSVEVEVHPQRWVADVLKGGHVWYRSFAPVTPEIEADLGYGEHRMINALEFSGSTTRGPSNSKVRIMSPGRSSFARIRRGYMRVTRHALWSTPTVALAASRRTGFGRRSNGFLRTVRWLSMRWGTWPRQVAPVRR